MNQDGSNIVRGEVQRSLNRIPLLRFDTTVSSSGASLISTVMLKGLSKSISVLLQAGIVLDTNTNAKPAYPATPGTIQITPISRGSGMDPNLWGNPIFSSPNFAGPQTLPNGWEFSSMAPQCAVDITIVGANWPVPTTGTIVLDILLEYTGKWWDPATVAMLLNKVTAEPMFNQPIHVTS